MVIGDLGGSAANAGRAIVARAREMIVTRGIPTELLRLPFVVHFCRGLNLIVFESDLAGLFFDVDASGLFARFQGASVADDVVAENKVLGLAAHADAGGVTFAAVVLNEVVLKPVAMRSHAGGFVAEENPVLMVGAHFVILQKIVGVFVADGDAETAVVFEDIFLEQPILDAPAKE